MDVVAVHIAWQWHCPRCAKRYYSGGELLTDPETLAVARAEFGDDWGGECHGAPVQVHCVQCNETFKTADTDEVM